MRRILRTRVFPMKTLAILLPVLFLVACQRPAGQADQAQRDAIEELKQMQEEAAKERQRMEEEQARLEKEKEALEQRLAEERQLRERVEMQAREREAAEAMDEARRREEETARREAELREQRRLLAEREAEAARIEQELSERELELAGREALGELDEPEEFQEPVADFDLFYDGLDEHGQWFDSPDYGYIYQPTVVIRDRSWRPYTRGRWICTDRGWTWISDEPFGWATYHYGRWVLLSGRGWCWVPGGEWAPAWVAWRHGGGHVGWAPLPPETLVGRGRAWGVSVEVDFGIADDWFCFVAERHFADPIAPHCPPVGRNAALRREARGCTNLHYRGGHVIVGGPSYAEVRRHVGRAWPVCRIENEPLVGFGTSAARRTRPEGELCRVFAPNVSAAWNPGLRPDKVRGRIDRAEVVRSARGISAEWARRYQEERSRERQAVRTWATRAKSERDARLASNREEVREAMERRGGGGSAGGGRLPEGLTPTTGRGEALAEIRRRMEEMQNRRNSENTRRQDDGSGAGQGGGTATSPGRGNGGAQVPDERRERERAEAARIVREQQEEASRREAAEQRRRAAEEAARVARERRDSEARGRALREAAEEQARRAREEAARRAADEARRQREAETARRAAEERARQIQQAREEAARRQAEERARLAQQAREEAARRQAEQARQAEEVRRQQDERQREGRERLREAGERLRERIKENRNR